THRAPARRQVRGHELHPVQRSAGVWLSSPGLGARGRHGAIPAPPRRAREAAPLGRAGRRRRLRAAAGASAGMTARNTGAALTAVLAGVARAAAAQMASADALGLVNSLRKEGCARKPPAPPVKANAALDAAARELARSGKLRESLESSGYAAARSESLHIKGP